MITAADDAVAARAVEAGSGSSLAALRIVVGLLGAVSCARFVVHGWVAEFWIDPAHHFHWPGLWWVRPLPAPLMYLAVIVTGASFAAAALATWGGRRARPWLVSAVVGFTYLGAIDVAPFLNHYVLLVLLAALLAALPEGVSSPAWCLRAAQTVVATVYLWAAVAKLDRDWLAGRTIRPWLAAHDTWPVVGDWFHLARTAQVLALAGLVFDALVVPALLWRRSRPAAYAAVIVFHVATRMLFPIGMFPWLMIGSTTVFFAPDWFDRWWRRRPAAGSTGAPRWAVVAALALIAVLPLRAVVSDVWWSEQGGRFSWRVMAVNKAALAELWVETANGEGFRVRPERDLSALQAQQVGWQPDLLLQWAHLVAARERERTGASVRVYADVWVSVNGHRAEQFVDPQVDLAQEHWTVGRPAWVLPAPAR